MYYYCLFGLNDFILSRVANVLLKYLRLLQGWQPNKLTCLLFYEFAIVLLVLALTDYATDEATQSRFIQHILHYGVRILYLICECLNHLS